MLKRATCLLFALFVCANLANLTGWWGHVAQGKGDGLEQRLDRAAVVRLGEELFRDERFSSPNGDLPASCSHCHLLDEDPQGLRAYADFFNRSWVSSRSQDRRRLELRNSPTILDASQMPRLHYDGEFASLEDLVKGTLAGRPLGWLPGEEKQAFEHVRAVVLKDEGVYRRQFKKAFGVDLMKLSPNETVELIAQAIAAYCRTLNTPKDSPYDKFIALNVLESRLAAGEDGESFGKRLLGRVRELEATSALKLTPEFDQSALAGLKLFFEAHRGNCVSCHAPPLFTDNSFHNLGVSQREYDRTHGDGAFAVLALPGPGAARRPATNFRETPAKEKPGEVDLGFWNFVDLKTSQLRLAGESDEKFLQRMIATFKTPTLRNLKYSQPYFHDGSLHTIEETLDELIQLSGMARAGQLREADRELARIKLTAAEITPLAAFLNSLNEDLAKLKDRTLTHRKRGLR